jgi:predicted HTH transcriptional regulator
MNEQEFKLILSDILASPKECEWVEIKENNYNPEDIGEYISSLSNGAAYVGLSKGYLLFGINDKTHSIVGTTFSPKSEKIRQQERENWIATQLSPRIDFMIHEMTVDKKRIVLFIIDSAGNTPVKFKGPAWIRVGSYKKKLSEHPERERKIWQNTHNSTFESKIALSGVSGDDVLTMIDYPLIFRLLKMPLPANKAGILEKLAEEKLINKRALCFDMTNLGAILFATDLKYFSILSRKAIRVIFYQDKKHTNATKEVCDNRGYAVCFKYIVDYINANVPVEEKIVGAVRKERPMYSPIAIREFIANAIIHQDFYIGGTSPMIEIFSNRIEITNPGKPLIDTLRFIDHSPQSRNEQLASMMRRMDFCEERGTGVDKAIEDCEYHQLPAPSFTEDVDFTRVTLFPPKTVRQLCREERIRACYQHCCLQYVNGDKMTNESLRNRLDIPPESHATASRIISDTINENLIKIDGSSRSKKFSQYLPIWG